MNPTRRTRSPAHRIATRACPGSSWPSRWCASPSARPATRPSASPARSSRSGPARCSCSTRA